MTGDKSAGLEDACFFSQSSSLYFSSSIQFLFPKTRETAAAETAATLMPGTRFDAIRLSRRKRGSPSSLCCLFYAVFYESPQCSSTAFTAAAEFADLLSFTFLKKRECLAKGSQRTTLEKKSHECLSSVNFQVICCHRFILGHHQDTLGQ